MPADSNAVRSLLKDVALNGVVVINKRKLIWLLGWGQDRSGVWNDLLEFWDEIGDSRNDLHGLEVADKIVLSTMPNGGFGLVSRWV